MANYYCGNCDLLETNGRVYYGDEYYCKKDGRTHKTTSKACSSLIKNKELRDAEAKGWHPSGWKFYIVTAIAKIIKVLYGSDVNLDKHLSKIRTEFLEKFPKYQETLEDYDYFGPMIAEIIEKHPNRDNIAMYLTNNYLVDALKYVIEDNYEEAAKIYFKMVTMLKMEYNLIAGAPDVETQDRINNYEMSLVRKQKKSDN